MAGRRTAPLQVCTEEGKKKVFASVLAWPGWCRSAKDEDGALAALAGYAPRYRPVAERGGLPFVDPSPEDFVVVERTAGSATTDFGAPGAIADAERTAMAAAAARRQAALVEAAWDLFDDVVAGAPPTLRKGRRGGGRDRDAIVVHVIEAEGVYARKLGRRPSKVDAADAAAVRAQRAELLEVLGTSWKPTALEDRARLWPPAYGARRIAWHVLDHAWEIEDRSR